MTKSAAMAKRIAKRLCVRSRPLKGPGSLRHRLFGLGHTARGLHSPYRVARHADACSPHGLPRPTGLASRELHVLRVMFDEADGEPFWPTGAPAAMEQRPAGAQRGCGVELELIRSCGHGEERNAFDGARRRCSLRFHQSCWWALWTLHLGTFLFPKSCAIAENRIVTRKRHFPAIWAVDEESMPRNRLASTRLKQGLLRAVLALESHGGGNYLAVHGVPKKIARKARELLESRTAEHPPGLRHLAAVGQAFRRGKRGA